MPRMQVPLYGDIVIPTWVRDLATFRTWVHSGELPEKFTVHFLNGDVWIDLHHEEMFSHNQVKLAVQVGMRPFDGEKRSGLTFGSRMLLTNDEGAFATEPDAMYVSFDALRRKQVWFTGGDDPTEVVGAPDVVAEVVSDSSEEKDTDWLMAGYHAGGIPEYWQVDARTEPLRFDIFRHSPRKYVRATTRDGWKRSTVFGKWFRLMQRRGRDRWPSYTLEMR